MTPDEAAERIMFHAEPQSGAFLYMLRPYRGVRDEVLRDVMAALEVCAPRLREEQISRELVSALWAISHFGRSWALHPGGMLRRNNLISDDDREKLDAFLEGFDLEVALLFDGVAEDDARSGDSDRG